MLRPLPPRVVWSWFAALALLLTYVLMASILPKPIELCARVLEERPASAFLAGALALCLLGPVTVLFVVSLLGIAVLPLLFLLILAGFMMGKAAVSLQIGRQAGLKNKPLPAALAAGVLAVDLLYTVPVVGLAVWALSSAFGLGAALLALFDALRAETGEFPAVLPALSAETSGARVPRPPASADLDLPRAGFWIRCGATALDGMIFLTLGALTGLIAVGFGGWAFYQIGMWAWKGTTIGGIVMGIKGVRVDGAPMDFSVALVRHLASYLSGCAAFLGFFWAGWDPEKQSWHDKIAGTLVVRVPKSQALI